MRQTQIVKPVRHPAPATPSPLVVGTRVYPW